MNELVEGDRFIFEHTNGLQVVVKVQSNEDRIFLTYRSATSLELNTLDLRKKFGKWRVVFVSNFIYQMNRL